MIAGRPRVVRKVIRLDGQKCPKVARDRRLKITLERVVARTEHSCQWCTRPITAGSVYASVSGLKVGSRMVVRGRVIEKAVRMHQGCVPAEVQPLLRLVGLT